MKQEHFLKLAREASKKSDHHSHKVGCVIVKRNRVIGIGWNLMKTHPKSPSCYKNIHAEFHATLNANSKVKGATVYVFRQQKNGIPAISRPCRYCWDFLLAHGAKQVVYSFEGSFKKESIG